MRPRMKKLAMFAPLAIVGAVLFVFVGGEIVKLLWNWLMPALFDVRQITFWQALGLLALCRILVGGSGGGRRSSMRRRMHERWEGSTPEERDRFRARVRERCGFGPPAGETKSL